MFWFGVSLLSPLRPILHNGNPLLNASPTKKPIVKVAVDVKKAEATEKAIGSDMVAENKKRTEC